MTPKVSIIVPSYNHRKYLDDLLGSIYAQTFKDFELIIIDDGSSDGSAEYLKEVSSKYNFTLILKSNEGLCKTLNLGLGMAKGKYIVNFASDDVMTPNRLMEQVKFLDKHEEIDVIAGGVRLMNEEGVLYSKKIPAKRGLIQFDDMIAFNRISAPTAMIRRSVFDQFGKYPEGFLMEDYYLWLKILSSSKKIYNASDIWVHYRVRDENLEKKVVWYYQGAVQALSEYSEVKGVNKKMKIHFWVFCTKLSLVMGTKFKDKYRDEYLKIDLKWRPFFICLMKLPDQLRNRILVYLKVKA